MCLTFSILIIMGPCSENTAFWISVPTSDKSLETRSISVSFFNITKSYGKRCSLLLVRGSKNL